MDCRVSFPLLDLKSAVRHSAIGRLNTIILLMSHWALSYLKHRVGTFNGLGGVELRRSAGRDFGNWIEHCFIEALRMTLCCADTILKESLRIL